jgi:tetratricopeptide (TPR) repeat protein
VQAHQIIIAPMNSDELRQSMQGQAAAVGLRFESNLIQQILDDVSGEPGAMPLLQHALWMLWKRRHGTWLKVDEYSAFGGVKQAIASTADDVFASCSHLEQERLRDIFLRLTRLDESANGRDTRRRVLLQELIPAGSDPAATSILLDKLINARLVVKNAARNENEVEVAHEALIQEWPTLRDWLTQDRQGLIIHQQLSEDTNDWLKLNRDHGSLYRGARLEQALTWAKTNLGLLNATEKEFLDASQRLSQEEIDQVKRWRRARSTQVTLVGTTIVLVTAMVVIVLALNGVFAPRKMNGTFNIAVAEFGEMRTDGRIYPSKSGQLLSGWTVSHLQNQLKQDPTIHIWPNGGNIFNRTQVALMQPDTVGASASAINASLLLYGYIDTRPTPPVLVLKFWIAPQAKYAFEEIQGSYGVGDPIRIVDMNNPGTGVQSELQRQATAISWVGIGLTNEQLGQSADALQAFLKAKEALPKSAMVQFFIGREHLFSFDQNPEIQQTEWQTAEDAFQGAISNDKQFARAYIGLGGIYFLRSAVLAQSALTSGQPLDPKAEEWIEKAIQSYQTVLDLKPDEAEYGIPVEEVARLALGNTYRLKGTIALIRGDVPAARDTLNLSITMLEQVRPAFEASVQQHESHRRYLAQLYEYLGEAHQWLGAALETQDRQQSLEAYRKSIESFDQCIAQGEKSFDLVIRDDIIQANCQPKFEEVQARYKLLLGGQP